ncbi:MAG: hypothetical protein SGI88_12740 [Candidatus Hydrogenedentes bacterium]|nr:hypothetical protein [Candidatus Hydrogenedentota bacterium]
MHTNEGRMRTVIVTATLCFVFIAVASLVAYPWYKWNNLTSSIDQHIATIRQTGLPVSNADLDDWYVASIPDENEAGLVENALLSYRETPYAIPAFVKNGYISTRERLTTVEMIEISKFLEANRPCLDAAYKAAHAPSCYYPPQFSLKERRMEYTSNLERRLYGVIHCVLLNSIQHAEQEDYRQAVTDIAVACKLSNIFKVVPHDKYQGIGRFARVCVMRCIEYHINHYTFPSTELRMIQDEVSVLHDSDALYKVIVGLRADVIAEHPWAWNPGLGPIERVLAAVDFEMKLDVYGDLLRASRLEPKQRQDIFEACNDRLVRALSKYVPPPPNNFPLVISPNILSEEKAFFRDSLQVYALGLIVAAERYRNVKGALPKNIDLLTPDYLGAPPRNLVGENPLLVTRDESFLYITRLGDSKELVNFALKISKSN